MMLAMDATSATLGLVIVFFVAFPALAHVLIGFAVAQAMGEKQENDAYAQGIQDEKS